MNEPMIVEGLLIVRKGVALDSLRCVINTESNDRNRMYFLPANVKTTIDQIWRVKCIVPAELREQISSAEKVLTAVIDYDDNVDKERRMRDGSRILQFHRPLIFDNQYVSKNELSHTVCTQYAAWTR